jgi:hypothetical protein
VQATGDSGDCRGKTWRAPAGSWHQNHCEAQWQQTSQISFAMLNQTKGKWGIPRESEIADVGINIDNKELVVGTLLYLSVLVVSRRWWKFECGVISG